jgi:hypothetical protein
MTRIGAISVLSSTSLRWIRTAICSRAGTGQSQISLRMARKRSSQTWGKPASAAEFILHAIGLAFGKRPAVQAVTA